MKLFFLQTVFKYFYYEIHQNAFVKTIEYPSAHELFYCHKLLKSLLLLLLSALKTSFLPNGIIFCLVD